MHRAPRHSRRTPPPSRSFRPDIEGLRALAVTSVLLHHTGLARTPGGFVGVDVFLVVSGFLITSMLARELAERGRLGLADFWARRARRLLPASSVVLVFSGLVSLLWLPATSRQEFGGDIAAGRTSRPADPRADPGGRDDPLAVSARPRAARSAD